MQYKRRDGTLVTVSGGQERILRLLYGTAPGRLLLKPLVRPGLSRLAGRFLSSSLSRCLIGPFIRANGIDMTPYEPGPYGSYNAFFSRQIRPSARPVDREPGHLIAPCDSKLTVLPITAEGRFSIKHTDYTVASLLKNEALARTYLGGQALIFRLSVDDYHRYCYVDDGEKTAQTVLPGVLHTVHPMANDRYPIYKENAREYCVLQSPVFGPILVMEVGALLVGKIVNHHGAARVCRGQEKGYFQFGGSTVVLLLPPGAARLDGDILENSAAGLETAVRCGEKIGVSARQEKIPGEGSGAGKDMGLR